MFAHWLAHVSSDAVDKFDEEISASTNMAHLMEIKLSVCVIYIIKLCVNTKLNYYRQLWMVQLTERTHSTTVRSRTYTCTTHGRPWENRKKIEISASFVHRIIHHLHRKHIKLNENVRPNVANKIDFVGVAENLQHGRSVHMAAGTARVPSTTSPVWGMAHQQMPESHCNSS